MKQVRGLWYIKRLSKCMRMVESGTIPDNMAWCRRHIFVNTDDKEGAHRFVCVFDPRVRLELFMIWVWEPQSCIHLIRLFLTTMKNANHQAPGIGIPK